MIRSLIVLLLGTSLWPCMVTAGPIYDPFLERFQVGAHTGADESEFDAGFPVDLLEPIRVDSLWVGSAVGVLDAGYQEGARFLTRKLADGLMDAETAREWYGRQLQVVGSLTGELVSGQSNWFLAERLALSAFRSLANGDRSQAALICRRLGDTGAQFGLTGREALVWYLRALALAENTDGPDSPMVEIWEPMLDLGPFDAGNAWALWIAHCREKEIHPLPVGRDPTAVGDFLGRIGRHWIEPDELYGSDLPEPHKAALGALMFTRGELARHYEIYPDPPADFELQGWWVRGMRMNLKGQPGPYEVLAARGDLHPGWRMDVWRRASEARLLRGDWDEGLMDLEMGLALAGDDAGTRSLRRRLRQWTEQALVLALATRDADTARKIRGLGRRYLQADELAAFEKETGHWAFLLETDSAPPADAPSTITSRALAVVETGSAADLAPSDSLAVQAFLDASDQPLWELWYRWGLELADPEAVTGTRRDNAVLYRNALTAGSRAATFAAMEDSAIAVIALRFRGRPEADILLRAALDHDVRVASGHAVAPDPSPVPDLAWRLRGSELDRHALLGFALASGDMRGILAVAVVLDGRGLTEDEKMRFLYPLPPAGPIRDAIAAAGSAPALLLAVARNESLFEPSVRSRAGALGWMQIMPFHYEERGALPGAANWRCPDVSIDRGDGLLVENRRRYEGDPYLAVAAYNAGPRAASRWREQLGGRPARDVYLAWIGYPETRHYVEKVLIDRHIYDWIIAGKDAP